MVQRPPLPPFTAHTAAAKVRLAEDGWNSRDPERVSLAYSTDSAWRNRAEFLSGRASISEDARQFRWPIGRRPDDHPGLSDLGL